MHAELALEEKGRAVCKEDLRLSTLQKWRIVHSIFRSVLDFGDILYSQCTLFFPSTDKFQTCYCSLHHKNGWIL